MEVMGDTVRRVLVTLARVCIPCLFFLHVSFLNKYSMIRHFQKQTLWK